MIIYRRMTCLTGKVVTDSQFFKDENHIWPEGYTAMRKFTSLTGYLLISFWLLLINQVFFHIWLIVISSQCDVGCCFWF